MAFEGSAVLCLKMPRFDSLVFRAGYHTLAIACQHQAENRACMALKHSLAFFCSNRPDSDCAVLRPTDNVAIR